MVVEGAVLLIGVLAFAMLVATMQFLLLVILFYLFPEHAPRWAFKLWKFSQEEQNDE